MLDPFFVKGNGPDHPADDENLNAVPESDHIENFWREVSPATVVFDDVLKVAPLLSALFVNSGVTGELVVKFVSEKNEVFTYCLGDVWPVHDSERGLNHSENHLKVLENDGGVKESVVLASNSSKGEHADDGDDTAPEKDTLSANHVRHSNHFPVLWITGSHNIQLSRVSVESSEHQQKPDTHVECRNKIRPTSRVAAYSTTRRTLSLRQGASLKSSYIAEKLYPAPHWQVPPQEESCKIP